jgi:rhodanese-related sulfurtransferase
LGGTILLGVIKRFFSNHPFHLRHGSFFWPLAFLAVVAISFGVASAYSARKQNQSYLDWVRQSLQQPQPQLANSAPDQLVVTTDAPTNAVPTTTDVPVVTPAVSATPDEVFIRSYYDNIGSGRIDEAYAVWTKTVSAAEYASWYKSVTGANINSIQHINSRTYSISITLKEGDTQSTYGALLELAGRPDGTIYIATSSARLLSSSTAATTATSTTTLAPTTIFYDANQEQALAVSNSDFANLTRAAGQYVLDAREDEEFSYGQYPGSVHIRYADLFAGEWIRLPVDRVVYVICWSGIRGEEVAKFLRSKKIVARYLENGANSWVNDGGAWNGEILFEKIYTQPQYRMVLNKKAVTERVQNGAVLVDSRPKEKFQQWHIPNSYNLAMLYTPTIDITATLNTIPSGADVITVCDDFVSCFDARVTGIRLEGAGHKFLGRYNKPWEFRQ